MRFASPLSVLSPILCTVAVLVGACASHDSSPPPDNGVNDVKLACQIRATWTRRQDNTCVECQGIAPITKCTCPSFADSPYMGKCQQQGEARAHEPTCNDTQLADCLHACKDDDCGCIDGCYAGRDKCRALSSAVDGCVADVCAQYCK